MRIIGYFLDLLFPTSCIVCSADGPDLCTKCIMGFAPPKEENHDWIFSMWNYRDENVEKLMRYIKNNPNARVADVLAEKLHGMITARKLELAHLKNVLIIPIPIHKSRFQDRGYNQSELLARPLAQILRRGLVTDVLYKNKKTRKQGTTKSKAERLSNISDSFSVKNSHQIFERDIVIVDDITTTGTTLSEARKTLLDAGARCVIAMTIAN